MDEYARWGDRPQMFALRDDVTSIGSAPDCAKNRAYLPGQKTAFLAGKSPPDFAQMTFEVDFAGRATEADLTPLGRRQMGF